MGIREVRSAIKARLQANTELVEMFHRFIEEEEPKPSDLDAIVIRKTGSDEEQQEFPVQYHTYVTYTYDIICYMKRTRWEEGDEAQCVSDELIREAIKGDITLGGEVSWCRPIETVWGRDSNNLDIYYTVVTVEAYYNASPTNREGGECT